MHASFPAVFPSLTGQYSPLSVLALIRRLLMTLLMFAHCRERFQELWCELSYFVKKKKKKLSIQGTGVAGKHHCNTCTFNNNRIHLASLGVFNTSVL